MKACLTKGGLLYLLIAFIMFGKVHAQNTFEGYWMGELNAADENVINLTISGKASALSVLLDNPDHPKEQALEAKEVVLTKNKLSFKLPQVRGIFNAVISEKDGTIDAKWIQFGTTVLLNFKKEVSSDNAGINGKWVCKRMVPKNALRQLYRIYKDSAGQYKSDYFHLAGVNEKVEVKKIYVSNDTIYITSKQVSLSGVLSKDPAVMEVNAHHKSSKFPFILNRVNPDTISSFHPRPLKNGVPPEFIYARPVETKDGWKTAEAGNAEFLGKMGAMMKSIMKEELKHVEGIVVAKGGKLIFEEYFYQSSRNKKHDLGEITGSITSALTGIAADKGFIVNANERVYPFFSDYNLSAVETLKTQITIRHLLNMNTGTSVNDFQHDSKEHLYESKDLSIYTLSQPIIRNPGEAFAYNSGNLIVLGSIIEKTTKQTIPDFALKNLFAPLGIKDYTWGYTNKGQAMTCDFFNLSMRDLAKFGQLYLNKGNWAGKRIISEKWITESTTDADKKDPETLQLKYMWWNTTTTINGKTMPMYFASSFNGSKLFVIPSLDVVFVVIGKLTRSTEAKIINGFMLPAVAAL
jgi:CubicO group peptidase (beta-lactamase class C family)